MRNKKLNSILLLVISFLFVLSPIVAVRGDLYACPSTSAGDTKILEVTVVDAAGLEDIFGTGWKTVLNTSFSGDASTLGAKLKTVVQGIRNNDTIDYSTYGAGVVTVCNITVDSWAFTTGEFLEANKTTSQVYVMRDPANLTAYVQGVRAFLHYYYPLVYSEGNVTVPWAYDGILQNAYLAQLPVPPDDYLADIIWDDGWYSSGANIIHDVTAGYTVELTGFTYNEDCTESWTYYDNGALIAYSLVNNESKVVYQYSIVLPGAAIPGYELSLFIGVSIITMIGLVLYMKRKR